MILDDLLKRIKERRSAPKQNSYVSCLLAKGHDEILKKIGEEAIEVIVASKAGSREQTIHELADLWFHCMVLIAEKDLSHKDILDELERRYNIKEDGQ